MEINGRGVNEIFDGLGHYLAVAGVEENSRNGPVIVAPEPVLVTYTAPQERVLFSPLRDANPFFHLLGDALWCLSGRNDLDWPTYFNSKFAQYSDDGITHPAAYGRRWRSYFGYDQLKLIVEELRKNPDSRRAVLTMWDGGCGADHPQIGEEGGTTGDLIRCRTGTKDAPCNTQVYVDLRGGALNITVCNRSNDFLFGLTGANAVQFSILQEYLAAALGALVGVYHQFSNNCHIYPANLPQNYFLEEESTKERVRQMSVDAGIHDYYKLGEVEPFPLVNTDIETWDADLKIFMENPEDGFQRYDDIFFRDVAFPMYAAWNRRKQKYDNGLEYANKIAAPDWRRACVEWIERRENRRNA